MKNALLLYGFLCFASTALAQNLPKPDLSKVVSAVNAFNDKLKVEKLYLQTDKSNYLSGDTLWLKAYLFDAASFKAATKSAIIYVEIANDTNRFVSRMMLPVYGGLAVANVVLDKMEMPQGNYILRAYTSWMRNFGEDYIFKKYFSIGSPAGEDWLVSYDAHEVKEERKNIELGMKFSQLDRLPVGLRNLQMMVTDGKSNWANTKVQTALDGGLKVNFKLPEKANANNISLVVQDLRKGDGRKLVVPVFLNRADRVDLQFMPEGGNLVAGIAAHIAFKAINEDGNSAEVSGQVYDGKGQGVAAFSSSHKGMGTFELLPSAGSVYSAKIKLPDGSYKTYPLPAVKATGTVLKVNNQLESDSCEVIVTATPDVAASGNTYFLIGQAREVLYYSTSFNLKSGYIKLKVSKRLFPSGVVRFTLSSPDQKALNERIVFIDHADHLYIQFSTNKTAYGKRDSVSLHIKVSDKEGNPVKGNFSLAVTDDGQVKTDSLTGGSILTKLLLSSALRGEVEDPGYYLQPEPVKDVKKWQHLDQLLLAQGWVGYNWDEVFGVAKVFKYEAEAEFLVRGKVTNVLNKPVVNSRVDLMLKKPLTVLDILTDEKGVFTFKGLFPKDNTLFFIQARNKSDRSFGIGIEMEYFVPPVFAVDRKRRIPWYLNIDTGRLLFADKQLQLQKDYSKITGNMLKEVIITEKKVIKGSNNMNGPGEADVIMNQSELEKVGAMTLNNLVWSKIWEFNRINKFVLQGTIRFIVDGIDATNSGFNPGDYYAEQIKGIEIMISTKYKRDYVGMFADISLQVPGDPIAPYAKELKNIFIEVTTRDGKGPYMGKRVLGAYLYKPLNFFMPKKFYTPKYKPTSIADGSDIRSTIYWGPNIATGKDGTATATFYTADIPGNYSLILEGSDMQGSLGVKRGSITVK